MFIDYNHDCIKWNLPQTQAKHDHVQAMDEDIMDAHSSAALLSPMKAVLETYGVGSIWAVKKLERITYNIARRKSPTFPDPNRSWRPSPHRDVHDHDHDVLPIPSMLYVQNRTQWQPLSTAWWPLHRWLHRWISPAEHSPALLCALLLSITQSKLNTNAHFQVQFILGCIFFFAHIMFS